MTRDVNKVISTFLNTRSPGEFKGRLEEQMREYDEFVLIQEQHLALWKDKLRPELYEAVRAHVLAHNSPDNPRSVWRGQDLIEVIRQWPRLRPPYDTPNPEDLI